MFENMNPLDRPTAFLEITILLFISFLIGYICARIPLGATKKTTNTSKSPLKNRREKESNETPPDDPRDIITEPTSIKAVLTRDRKGNPINPMKETDPDEPINFDD